MQCSQITPENFQEFLKKFDKNNSEMSLLPHNYEIGPCVMFWYISFVKISNKCIINFNKHVLINNFNKHIHMSCFHGCNVFLIIPYDRHKNLSLV